MDKYISTHVLGWLKRKRWAVVLGRNTGILRQTSFFELASRQLTVMADAHCSDDSIDESSTNQVKASSPA
jgi:hypothetical protein